MASKAFSDITDEFLVCQVCLEDFKHPKVLPCLHTFCQPCLEKLLTTEPVGKLDCPTCRQDVSLPRNGVQGLKSNFLVGKLRDILQQQPKGETSETRKDGVRCTVCEDGNSAQFYCVECTEYLCQKCNHMHGRFKGNRAHKVVTIQDLQSGQAAAELRARETSGRLEETADDKSADKVDMTKHLMNLTFEPPTSNIEQGVSELVGGIKQTAMPMLSSPPGPATQVRPNAAIAEGGASLKLIKTVGERGSGDGQFSIPSSLAVTVQGGIVLTDCGNSRLLILDKDGSFREKVDLSFKPECVAALTNGELLVTGDGHKIHVLDKQGRESRVIQVTGAAEIGKTEGVAVDGLGRIIVTIGYQVFVLSPSGGVILKFGDKGGGQQQLGSFLHVANCNSSNQIIISDKVNNTLKIFDPSGRHLFTCGSFCSGPGQLYDPWSVITDSEDNIIVADQGNHRVSVFSRDGTFIRHVLTQEEHGLCYPLALALTHDGHLVVAECHSIKIFA